MKRWLCYVLAIFLLLNAVGCRFVPDRPPSRVVDKTVVDLTEKIPLSGELINSHIHGNLLRVECISPGLDTFALSVALYSLTDNKVLGYVDLGESDWYTGWTDSGFYAASVSDKSVKFYDNTCQLKETRTIPDSLGRISFFAMNEVADTYFIGAGETASLYLYDVNTNTPKDVGRILYGYQNPLGYRDGYFYFEDEDDLLRIHERGEYATTVYSDSRHLYKFIDMGIGTREDHFYIVPADLFSNAVYVPMQEEGEYPVTAEGSRFVTLTADTVRVYDLANQTSCEWPYTGVQSVALYGDTVLIHTFDGVKQHLYQRYLNPTEKDHISISASQRDDFTAPSTTFPTATPRPSSHLIDVPIIPQMPDYPTGCESVSAVMALNYWGENISVADFIDKYLPKSEYFYSKGDMYYGPDPFHHFVGDPRTTNSYGCMAPVIQRAISDYFGTNKRVLNLSGSSLSQLCAQHIVQNRPVLVWVTINMMETFVRAQWRLEDGSIFEWPANEHCMVLVGFDKDYYYFNDPYTGQLVKYEHLLSEDRYLALGQQALVIIE